MRILIAGGPKAGKTTLASQLGQDLGIPVKHTDDLIASLSWSEASQEVARWMEDGGDWIIEGVAVPRALRKFFVAHPNEKPCDVLYWLGGAHGELTKGQAAMQKGVRTVLDEVSPSLSRLCVELRSHNSTVTDSQMAAKRKKPAPGPKLETLLRADPECDDDEDEDDYPEEFRLFSMGENVAYTVGRGHSVVGYDNICGAKVMQANREHGMDMLPIDHEHQTFNAPLNGQTAPAHGWFVPEHRDNDGLYATAVKFTESGKDLLAKGKNGEPSQYRFYSPAVELDEDGKVCRLHNAALTNLPALARLKPLMAASQVSQEETHMDPKEAAALKEANEKLSTFHDGILNALGVKTTEEASGALAGLLAARGQVDELQKRLCALETEAKSREAVDVTTLIDAAVKDGRVPPAKREEVVELYSSVGRKGIEKYLSMLSPLPSQEPVKQANAAVGTALLSASEKKIAQRLGVSEEDFTKTRDAVKQRRAKLQDDDAA